MQDKAQKRSFSFLRILAVLMLISPMLFSCNSKAKKEKNAVVDIMKSDKLTKEALSRSWNILKGGQQLADNGKSIDEIIKTFPDSTIIQTNNSAILFFIEGSVPMLIELPTEENKRRLTKGGGGSHTQSLSTQSSNLFSSMALTSFSNDDDLVDVIASEKGEDDRQEKKALILSPYLSEFGNNDDGLVAKKYLEKNKNYKGNVDHISTNLSLENYTAFDDYDLVHISAHGLRFCDEKKIASDQLEIVTSGNSNYCRTLIDTGIKHNFENEEDMQSFYLDPKNIKYVSNIIHHEDTFFLKSSFFDEFYGSGLKNKIWVFSACELGQRSDLSETMKNIHTNGHFFYWLNTVYAEDAYPAFDKFYKNLVKEGLDAKKAFEKIPVELRSNLPSEFNGSITTTTSLIHLQTNEPHHGIEVIEMKHPEEKNKTVKEGDFYPLVGDFNDGKPEVLTLKVELKGYKPSEFEEKQMSISLKVDNEAVLTKKLFLPDEEDDEITIKTIEDKEHGVEVTITDIEIPDVGDKEKITLKAYLHLNDENFSIHTERVTIKADGVKATIRGEGKIIVFTYDDKRRTIKMQTAQAPSDVYMDEAGYMYSKPPNKEWMKVHLKGMMNMLPMLSSFAGSGFEEIVGSDNSNIIFPIVEWGIRFRMSAFERSKDENEAKKFKKHSIDCGKPEPCHKFVGIAEDTSSSYAIFDPSGKLKELNFKGNTIKYEYGEYNVILPEAKELSIFDVQ